VSSIGTPQSSTHRNGEDGSNSFESPTLEDIEFDLYTASNYDSEPVQYLNGNSPRRPLQFPGPSTSSDIISDSGTSESVRQLQLEVGFAAAAFPRDDDILGSQLQNMTLAFSNPSDTLTRASSFSGHAHIQEAPEFAMTVPDLDALEARLDELYGPMMFSA
jgi:hypothetical protein